MAGIYILAGVLLTVAVAVIRSWWRDLRKDHGLTKPLGSIAGLYGAALILYVVGAAYSVFHVLGGGQRGSVCVNTGTPARGVVGPGHMARAGASISAVGNIRACALHPGILQWALYLLTRLPGIMLWGCVILVLWRFVGRTSRSGPFTPACSLPCGRWA